MDSGDNTDLVYDFCASNADWALPSKGSSHPMDTHFRISKVNKTDSRAYGMQLAIIDTGKYKDMIAGRMRKRNGTGSWMVYRGCDREYAEQVTAEHKVNVKSGQRTIQAWVLKTSHADNHLLDCEVYAMVRRRYARRSHLPPGGTGDAAQGGGTKGTGSHAGGKLDRPERRLVIGGIRHGQ